MTSPRSTLPQTWSPVFKIFHWTTAALILAVSVLGWAAVAWPLSPAKLELFKWHKSIGLLILGWVILRLAFRATHPRPALPPDMPVGERRAAHLSHLALYILVIAMPVSGWIINSASNFPLMWFGLFRVPQIAAPGKGLEDTAALVHLVLFWSLLVVVVVHVAAALRHHFVLRNNVLARMLPFGHHRRSDR